MKKRRGLILAGLVLVVGMLLYAPKAAAFHTTELANIAPYYITSNINDKCHNEGWNVVQLSWVSPVGQPTATTVDVFVGTTRIDLELNRITYRCRANTSSIVTGSFIMDKTVTNDASVTVNNLDGTIGTLDYVPTNTTGEKHKVIKQFYLSGQFNDDRSVTITASSRGTISKSDGSDFCAQVSNEGNYPTPDKFNFDPDNNGLAGYCYSEDSKLTIRIRVNVRVQGRVFNHTTRANMSGVRIDTCGHGIVTSSSDGLFTATIHKGDNFCLKVAGGVPLGVDGPFVRPWRSDYPGQTPYCPAFSGTDFVNPQVNGKNYCTKQVYECQRAGVTSAATNCPGVNYDRNRDNGYDFVFVPLPQPTCAINSMDAIEPGQAVLVRASITNNATVVSLPSSNYTARLTVSGGLYDANVPFSPDPIARGGTSYIGPGGGGVTVTPTAPGSYTVTLKFSGPYFNTVCTGTLSVEAKPYFQANGGDVLAGSSFATSTATACAVSSIPPDSSAGIVSWNKRAPSYHGAGGMYAAFAMDHIQDYVTNQGSGHGPASLSFTNESGSVNPAGGMFGGMFDGAPCVDYWGSKPDFSTLPADIGSGPIDLAALGSGTYRRTGDLTIAPSNIANGTRLTIYVEGNVYILPHTTGRAIVYGGSDTNWNDYSKIPSVRIIAHGSIFIDANVQQLDGLYVAVPDTGYQSATGSYSSPLRGTISTCSNPAGSYNPQNPGMVAACKKPLTVHGSLVGNQIWLLRTGGTIGTGAPAEVINYGPEMWLAPPSGGTLDPAYRAIVGLPPVL